MLPDAEEVHDGIETKDTPTVWVLVLRYEFLVVRVEGEIRNLTVTATRRPIRGARLDVSTRHEHLPGKGTLLVEATSEGLPAEVASVRADRIMRFLKAVTAARRAC
ncbi:MAG TPA: hypothetical protein VE932_04915 [Patescibacteria group bacterium]|nr:hypothetical protein [Patescibacteria group bacterium]